MYWTNIPGITQPTDRGIVLKDILEDDFDSERDKSYCIDANYSKTGIKPHHYQNKYRRQLVSKPKQVGIASDINGHDILKRVYSPEGKLPILNTTGGSNRESKVAVEDRIVVDSERKRLIIAEANAKGYTIIEDGDCFDINYPNSKTRRGRKMKYKCNALTPSAQEYMHFKDLTWRKLTPLECERLQTVPDNYTASVSNTQRYKMLGNGWTVEVIAHILTNMETK